MEQHAGDAPTIDDTEASLFDAEWYLRTYPDVAEVGADLMTPLIFYSCITMPKQARLSWTPLFVSGWVT